MENYIAYYRVSTKDQNLGLEAQKEKVHKHLITNNGNLLHEYEEKETGTAKKQRVEIYKAIEQAKQNNATLIIAKLDRLSRNVAFTAQLMDSGVKFIALDIPNANSLTIHIIAAMAQHEAKLISERTKAALQVLKDKGVKLGSPNNLTQEGRLKGARNNMQRAKANENNKRAKAYVNALNTSSLSLRAIAIKLNEAGFKTSRGLQFQATSVKRLLDAA